jgi:hypothetical protein
MQVSGFADLKVRILPTVNVKVERVFAHCRTLYLDAFRPQSSCLSSCS